MNLRITYTAIMSHEVKPIQPIIILYYYYIIFVTVQEPHIEYKSTDSY